MNFNKNYYNNEFNYLISELTDRNRSIMDIDCFISKIGSKYGFIIDHKKHTDKVSINTLRELSKFVDVKLNDNTYLCSFIIRSDINTNEAKTDTYSIIYELKNWSFVKDKKMKIDYVKHTYTIRNDQDLKLFFQPETHTKTKERLRNEL